MAFALARRNTCCGDAAPEATLLGQLLGGNGDSESAGWIHSSEARQAREGNAVARLLLLASGNSWRFGSGQDDMLGPTKAGANFAEVPPSHDWMVRT